MIFINTTDLLGPDWRFLEPLRDDPAIAWQIHSGRARTALERRVRGIAPMSGMHTALCHSPKPEGG